MKRAILIMIIMATLLSGCAEINEVKALFSIKKFQLTDLKWQRKYDHLYVAGKIVNYNSIAVGAEIEVKYFDSRGVFIGSAKFWPNSDGNIAPYGSVKIEYPAVDDERLSTFTAQVISAHIW